MIISDQCNCSSSSNSSSSSSISSRSSNHQHHHHSHHHNQHQNHRRKSFPSQLHQSNVWLLLICIGCCALALRTCSASKLGVHMDRSPESTIAPLFDEVLFECQLNLKPDELKWRFRPLNSRADYKYINKNVSIWKIWLFYFKYILIYVNTFWNTFFFKLSIWKKIEKKIK